VTTPENLAERLARVQAAFQDAPANGGGSSDPPDGDYQALIHSFEFFEAGTPIQAFVKIVLQIQHHPEYGGREVGSVFSLEDPDRIGFLKAALARVVGSDRVDQLNLAVDCLPGSEFIENEMLDVPVLIRIKRPGKTNSKGYEIVNVYIEQRLGDQVRPASVTTERRIGPDGRESTVMRSDVPSDTSEFDATRAAEAKQAAEDADNPLFSAEERREALLEAGCICEDPVAVADGDKATAHVDCPLPGHAPF
jgi:hypothetical protein